MYLRTSHCLIFRLVMALMLLPATSHSQESIPPVSATTVITGEIHQTVPLTGSVTAINASQLSPKEEGYVDKLMVDKGEQVSKGQPLLHLDRQLADLEIARVEAQIAEAQARVKEFRRQRDEAAELVKKKHIAATTFESTAAEVEINLAVVQRLRAELARQKAIASRHTVFAPFDGVITDRMVEVGQWVDLNTTLFNLTALDTLRVEVPAPQFYFNQVAPGTPVTIRFDALPERSFSATVSARIPNSNTSTRTFPLLIRIDNPDHLFAPGMSARVQLLLQNDNSDQSLLVPRDAIVQQPGGKKLVWQVESGDDASVVSPVTITTGRTSGDLIEILTGELTAGTRIIVRGNELLRDGQQVNVIEQLSYAR